MSNPAVTADSLATLSIAENGTPSAATSSSASTRQPKSKNKGKAKAEGDFGSLQPHPKKKASGGGPKSNPSTSTKLRGMERDSPEVRVSKTVSWLLRHGAQGEGLSMRKDGYVKVVDLLENPKLKVLNLDLEGIKRLVRADAKKRYDLVLESTTGVKLEVFAAGPVAVSAVEAGAGASAEGVAALSSTGAEDKKDGVWWIKANQGHSIKTVKLELKPITSVKDIPTGVAVHGTNRDAWKIISTEGLSKMKRNHIHLAQNVAGQNVVSGMRTSSHILIYIDVKKSLDAGIKFWMSDNGVVLTEGNEHGYLLRRFFEKVVDLKSGELHGWEETH